MTTQYHLTEHDFFALQKNSLHQLTMHKKGRIAFTVVAEILAIFYGIVLLVNVLPQQNALYPLVGSLIIGLLLLPFITKLYQKIVLRQTRSIIKTNTKWPRKVTLHLSESGIEFHSTHHNVTKRIHVAWEAIQNMSEDETNRYLYFQTNEVFIIPKRNHGISEIDQTEINRWLQDRLHIKN
ncbi:MULTISPECIES: YcxB family protein [unclassified Exiguobacterium]|uniref:YcxB family protein n=1 Tax=unclassified Exiguobacterium TaxID=2644629 RepID=UPI001BECF2D4|nr:MULTISPECIES: YcxB family protein [unclassified Exiguobacterium]